MADSDATLILAKVIENYRSLASYTDEGEVLQSFERREKPHRIEFSTAFKKPTYFRFTFSSPHPYPPLAHVITTHTCGFDGAHAYLWTKPHQESASCQVEEDLNMAVAGATGISGGSAHTIAALLLPTVEGFGFQDLESPIVQREEVFEGTRCMFVEGKHPRGGNLGIWIDSDRLLVRRLLKHWGKAPSTEIRRNIRVNESIQDSRFEMPGEG